MATVNDSFPEQSAANEFANAVTHGVGFLLSIGGAIALFLRTSNSAAMMFATTIYVSSLAAVFAFSTLSHAIQEPKSKQILRAWDQGTIYLLIAGTYTPMLLSYVSGAKLWTVLLCLWGVALAGCYSKVAIQHRVNALTTWSYILLGWLPAFAFVGGLLPVECVRWVVMGGICYTVGTLFLKMDQHFGFFHSIWHLFVITGSACHYYVIYHYAGS